MSREGTPRDADEALDRDLERWRQIASADEAAAPAPAALARMRGQVDALVAGDRGTLGRLRSLPRWQRAGLLAVLMGLWIGAVVTVVPRSDLAAYPVGHLVLVLSLLTALALAAVWRLFRPLHMPGSRRAGLLLVGAAGVVVPFALSAWPVDHVGVAAGAGVDFWVACLKCLAFGGALGLPLGLVSRAARRAQVGGAAVAMLAGVLAGLVGNLALQLHCPITEPAHLLWGHAPLLVMLGGLAAWEGRARG